MREGPVLGKKPQKGPMFCNVRMDRFIPEIHLLRLIDRLVDLSFIREKIKH